MHFLIPIGMLIWCLMIEELSPALSAFWATVVLMVLMVSQGPLITFFRGQTAAVAQGAEGRRAGR